MRLKKSKTWDVRWNWLRQKERLKEFKILWEKGKNNIADLFTKIHSPQHHRKIILPFIITGTYIRMLISYQVYIRLQTTCKK